MHERIFLEEHRGETRGKMDAESGKKGGKFPPKEGEDDAKRRGENGEDFPPRNGEDSQNEAESPLSTVYQLNPRLQHTRCRGSVNAYPRRNAWGNKGEEGKKTGKIPGRRERREENGEDGHGKAAERGKTQGKREDLDGRERLATPYTGDSERLKSLAAGVRRPRFSYWVVSSRVPNLRLVPEGDAADSSTPGGVKHGTSSIGLPSRNTLHSSKHCFT